MPPQRHAGKVGYGPNYNPSSVSPSINISPVDFNYCFLTHTLICIYLDAQRQGDRSERGADGEDHA